MDDTYSRAGNAADPPYLARDYVGTRTRSPQAAAGHHPADALGDHRPGLRPFRRACRRRRTSPGSMPASRWASASSSRAACSTRADGPCPTRWSRSGSATPRAATSTRSTSTRRRSIPTSPAPAACVTDAGGNYRFVTIKPGAYPWRNHPNAWRPAHIHLSLFGPSFLTRLVDADVLSRRPAVSLRSDLQLRARRQGARAHGLPVRPGDDQARVGAGLHLRHRAQGRATPPRWTPTMPERTPSQTVGPYLHIGLAPGAYGVREVFSATVADPGIPGTHIRIEGRIFDGEGNIVPDAMVEIWQADSQGRYAHPADGRPLDLQLVPRLRPLPDRQGRRLSLRHRQARRRARPRRQHAGAAHQRRACSRAGS